MIVGTAGHIDHGKTALVAALTGVDTDRLKEEKARGITIELGYAYQPLAGGEVLGFIDVPGHERLVHTMLAGAAGIDFALLVVAADDGVMPQTREHLAILHLLGIRQGAVALTKVDRAEAGRLAEVSAAIDAVLAPTHLAGAPIFPVCAPRGQGIAALRDHLHGAAQRFPVRPAAGGFRLAVDRSFTLKGTGTVVTGTVFAGVVEVGAELMLSPGGQRVRLRGLHAQGRPAERGTAGQRCALNLAGIDKDAIARGDWVLAPWLHHPVERFDACLGLLRDAPVALGHWSPVHLHLGSAHVMARVVLLDAERLGPGQQGLAQLVPEGPLGTLTGDAFILRDTEARHTLGGGRVLDIFAPARKRRTLERLEVLAALDHPVPAERLGRVLALSPQGLDLDRLALGWNCPDLAAHLPAESRCIRAGGGTFAIAAAAWASAAARLLAGLTEYHGEHPDELGPDVARARRMWLGKLPGAVFDALLTELIARGELARRGAWLHLPGHRLTLSGPEQALAERVMPLLLEQPYDPPWVRDIAGRLAVDEAAVRRLLLKLSGQGMAYQVVRDLFYAAQAMERLVQVARALGEEQGEVRAAAFRDRVGIGRKRCIQILEHFDRIGLTRRVRDGHKVRTESALVGG